MAITTHEIIDNHKVYELIIIGSSSGDSHLINVSDLTDAVEINGVVKQRMNILVEYSLDPNCNLLVEFSTNSSGLFTGIESDKVMDINTSPSATIDATTEAVTHTSSSGVGSGATFLITSEGGQITRVVSSEGGSGYSDGDTVTFSKAFLNSLGTLGTVSSGLILNVDTGAKQWNGYGTGKIYLKNTIGNSNGDIRLTFEGAAGCCKVFAYKTEGFVQASPYYKKVSGRIVT